MKCSISNHRCTHTHITHTRVHTDTHMHAHTTYTHTHTQNVCDGVALVGRFVSLILVNNVNLLYCMFIDIYILLNSLQG